MSLKRRYDASLFEDDTDKRPLKRLKYQTIDEDNKYVFDLVDRGKSIFITGSAGTGKSTLLKQIIERLPSEGTYVTASTGIAATQINGMTLHSFAGVGLGDATKSEMLARVNRVKSSVTRWQRTQRLIVDEISMIDADFFDALEQVARITRGIQSPFGGIQVICCGDFLQLPPVGFKDGRNVKFCFESEAWNKTIRTCINLTTIHRQKNDDFVRVLEEIRQGVCSRFAEERLRQRIVSETRRYDDLDAIEPTRLFCLNKNVDAINRERLDLLPGEATLFQAIDRGNKEQLAYLECNAAPDHLLLKIGAQVMLTTNVDPKAKLCNGSRGTVVGFETCQGSVLPIVKFNGGVQKTVAPHTWKVMAEGKVVASRTQIPLKIAWALSVHKSQGQSLDLVEIKCDDAFEYGQLYVALSRVTSLEGLTLIGFDPKLVKAHPKVLAFYAQFKKN